MGREYVLLTEKEEMWARMLMEVLEDHGIPCTAVPVFGAGLALRGGRQECLKVYVPSTQLSQATELMQALFSAEILEEDEE